MATSVAQPASPSRQTEFGERFRSDVVCTWLGNSEPIALKHDLQVRESNFPKWRAFQGTPHLKVEFLRRTESAKLLKPKIAKTLEVPRVLTLKVGDEGLEPPQDFGLNFVNRIRSDAKSDARSDADAILAGDDDPHLLWLIDAWPKLSADARRALVEFVGQELGAVVETDGAC